MKKKSAVQLHHEYKNKTGELLSDIILGGQDGLVNTLGVILGIAAASGDLRIVVAGGLAGGIAEAISMGAVGYTSKLAERDFYLREKQREEFEIENMPSEEEQEVRNIYEKKGFKGDLLESVVKVVTADRKVWLDTMMQEELNLTPIRDSQPANSAFLIGFSSFVGALIPLIPFLVFYFGKINFDGPVLSSIYVAIGIALLVSALTLFIVGAIKAKLTIGVWYKSGTQMLVIGIVSAMFGFLIGKIFSI